MKKLVITCAMLALGANLAVAGDFNFGNSGKNIVPIAPAVPCDDCLTYDYIDLNYVKTDYGATSFDDGKGFSGNFSKSLGGGGHGGGGLFLTGAFERVGYDYDWIDHTLDVKTNRYRLGLGARHRVAKCFDVTFEGGAQYLQADYSQPEYIPDHDYDSWGWYAGPGFRMMLGKKLEVYGNAFYGKHEGDEREEFLSHHTPIHGKVDDYFWRFTPGIVYYVTDNVGLKFGAEFERDDTEVQVGVRIAY